MNGLGKVLEKYRGFFFVGGERSLLDVKQLRADLEQVRRTNVIFFWVAAVMILVLFVASIGVSIAQSGSTGLSLGVPAGSAFGSAFLIRWMVALWREKTLTEFLLVLAANSNREVVLKEVMLQIEQLLKQGGILQSTEDNQSRAADPASADQSPHDDNARVGSPGSGGAR